MTVGIDKSTSGEGLAPPRKRSPARKASARSRDERVQASKAPAAPRDGRDRLLAGAGRLLAERGYAAMELRDVAERGKAPRGSIYHHFPRGKAQLAAEAAALDGERTRG